MADSMLPRTTDGASDLANRLIQAGQPLKAAWPDDFVYGSANGFSVIKGAPHSNAAKVFVNWLLDKDAQALWVDASNTNSRRVDVPGPASTALYPEVERRTVNDEAYFDYELKARDIAKQVLK